MAPEADPVVRKCAHALSWSCVTAVPVGVAVAPACQPSPSPPTPSPPLCPSYRISRCLWAATAVAQEQPHAAICGRANPIQKETGPAHRNPLILVLIMVLASDKGDHPSTNNPSPHPATLCFGLRVVPGLNYPQSKGWRSPPPWAPSWPWPWLLLSKRPCRCLGLPCMLAHSTTEAECQVTWPETSPSHPLHNIHHNPHTVVVDIARPAHAVLSARPTSAISKSPPMLKFNT